MFNIELDNRNNLDALIYRDRLIDALLYMEIRLKLLQYMLFGPLHFFYVNICFLEPRGIEA